MDIPNAPPGTGSDAGDFHFGLPQDLLYDGLTDDAHMGYLNLVLSGNLTSEELSVYTDNTDDHRRLFEMAGLFQGENMFIKTDVLSGDVQTIAEGSATPFPVDYAAYNTTDTNFRSVPGSSSSNVPSYLGYNLTQHLPQFGVQDSPLCFPFTYGQGNTPASPGDLAGPSSKRPRIETDPQQVPQASSALQAPQASPPLQAPQASPPLQAPQVSPPLQAPQASPPLQAPQASPPLQAPQVSPPLQAPQASPPLQAPQVSPPLQAPQASPAPQAPQAPRTFPSPHTSQRPSVAPVSEASTPPVSAPPTPTLQVPPMPHVGVASSAQSGSRPSTPTRGVIATPAPSRPSSPPLAGPILGYSTDLLRLAHVITRKRRRTTSEDSSSPSTTDIYRISIQVPRDWRFQLASFVPGFQPPCPTISSQLIFRHEKTLRRVTHRGLLIGALGVFDDADAASQFICAHPNPDMAEDISTLVKGVHAHISASPEYINTRPELAGEVSRRVSSMLSNDKQILASTKKAKISIAEHIEELFKFIFENLLQKRDSSLLGILQQGSPAQARARLNVVTVIMAYAHYAVLVDFQSVPRPLSVETHPEVDDFRQETTIALLLKVVRILHWYRAFKKYFESKTRAEQEGRPWNPTPSEKHAFNNGYPAFRFGSLTEYLLRIILPGYLKEVYFLNFQAPFLLFAIRFALERIHQASLKNGDEEVSVLERFLRQQMQCGPRSPTDLVWRLIIFPLAMCATALYVARENIELFFNGSLKADKALKLTPQAALVFQAKLLAVERVIKAWLRSPCSKTEYPLLRHRLMAIMADIITPVSDDFTEYDLVGPDWTTNHADHLGFGQSFTSRDHELEGRSDPLTTKVASILESASLVGSRSQATVVNLLFETRPLEIGINGSTAVAEA